MPISDRHWCDEAYYKDAILVPSSILIQDINPNEDSLQKRIKRRVRWVLELLATGSFVVDRVMNGLQADTATRAGREVRESVVAGKGIVLDALFHVSSRQFLLAYNTE